MPSPSSRPTFEKPPHEPSKPSKSQRLTLYKPSSQHTAQTSSLMQATAAINAGQSRQVTSVDRVPRAVRPTGRCGRRRRGMRPRSIGYAKRSEDERHHWAYLASRKPEIEAMSRPITTCT
jgi:hypothetical protein